MSDTSHASIVVILRQKQDCNMPGELEMLVLLYTKYKKGRAPFTSWKFPTETGEPGETPWKTASNGIYRELSVTPDSPTGFEFCSPDVPDRQSEPLPFLTYRVPGDPDKGYKWHEKHAFIVYLSPDSDNHLRTEERWDSPDELLGVPEYVEARELWRRMLERGQPFHRAVLYKTIERFARDHDVCERYRSILEDPHSQEAMKSRGVVIQFAED